MPVGLNPKCKRKQHCRVGEGRACVMTWGGSPSLRRFCLKGNLEIVDIPDFMRTRKSQFCIKGADCKMLKAILISLTLDRTGRELSTVLNLPLLLI